MNSKTSTPGLAIAGFILAIIGVLLSAVPIINNFAFVLAIFGFIFGIVGIVKTKGGQRKGRGISVTAVILAIVTVVIVLASQAMYSAAANEIGKGLDEASDSLDKAAGKSTEELLKNDISVEIGAFAATVDEYGLATTSLPVKVTNKNAEKKSYTIQVEAVDASGTRILDETVYANDLGSGQAQELKAFEYVPSDKIEALKSATFKVATVSQI